MKRKEIEPMNTDEMVKPLRECPFCGGEAKYYTDCDMTQVQCAVCGATPSGWWDEAEDAAAEWNRRAQPSEKPEPDADRGIYSKYKVTHADGRALDGDCFVLRPDRDPAAMEALRAYAATTPNKVLAADILQWVERYGMHMHMLGWPTYRSKPKEEV